MGAAEGPSWSKDVALAQCLDPVAAEDSSEMPKLAQCGSNVQRGYVL